MTNSEKKPERKRKRLIDYYNDYTERNQVKRVVVFFHMTDERERGLYERLKEHKTTKHVVLDALEQFFKNSI